MNNDETPIKPTTPAQSEPQVHSSAWLDAVAEYFNWLNEEEIIADAAGNRKYADAMARASSELGCLLIKHKIYREMKASNEKAHPQPGSATQPDQKI